MEPRPPDASWGGGHCLRFGREMPPIREGWTPRSCCAFLGAVLGLYVVFKSPHGKSRRYHRIRMGRRCIRPKETERLPLGWISRQHTCSAVTMVNLHVTRERCTFPAEKKRKNVYFLVLVIKISHVSRHFLGIHTSVFGQV